MASKPDYSKLAAALVGGKPLDFKHYPDGSLGVIAPTGQKFVFTPVQVAEEQNKQSKPAPEPAPKASKTARKPANKK